MSGTLSLITVSIPLLVGAVLAMAEVVLRRDLGVGRKAGWVAALWIVPVGGLAAYMLVRPRRSTRFRTARRGSPNEAAVALVAIAEAYQRGEIDDARYDADIARFHPSSADGHQRVS
jgi:hypothetical protein